MENNNQCVLEIRVIPNAKRNSTDIMDDGKIKIHIKAVPADGKANKALILYLSEILNIKKGNISIITGVKNKNKTVMIDGLNKENCMEKLWKNIRQQ